MFAELRLLHSKSQREVNKLRGQLTAAAEAKEAEVARLKAERPGLVRDSWAAACEWAKAIWNGEHNPPPDEAATIERLTGEAALADIAPHARRSAYARREQ
jgi:hypothetical protein